MQNHRGERIGTPSTALLALGVIGFIAVSGCASVPAEGRTSLDEIGTQLVEAAEFRANLGAMRVWLYEVHEIQPEAASGRSGVGRGHGDDLIGAALAHEFVIALSGKLNLVDAELFTPQTFQESDASLGDRAAAYGVTHLLVGDYVRSGDELAVSIRLIEADSRLIVAAARGVVLRAELGIPIPDVAGDPGPTGQAREGH